MICRFTQLSDQIATPSHTVSSTGKRTSYTLTQIYPPTCANTIQTTLLLKSLFAPLTHSIICLHTKLHLVQHGKNIQSIYYVHSITINHVHTAYHILLSSKTTKLAQSSYHIQYRTKFTLKHARFSYKHTSNKDAKI